LSTLRGWKTEKQTAREDRQAENTYRQNGAQKVTTPKEENKQEEKRDKSELMSDTLLHI